MRCRDGKGKLRGGRGIHVRWWGGVMMDGGVGTHAHVVDVGQSEEWSGPKT